MILEKNGIYERLTDFPCQYYGYRVFQDKIQIVYEEKDGSFVLFCDMGDHTETETFLCSKEKTFQNREIRLEGANDTLYLFFSAYYKHKKFILLYKKSYPVRIFDTCDDMPFHTLQLENGDIFVLYQKKKTLGYSILRDDDYTKFVPVDAKNPLKLFLYQNNIWLLTLEEQYILYNLTQKKQYFLPLVFHKKPFLYFYDSKIEIRYRFLHKNIIYILEEDSIKFLREEDA